MGIANRKAFTLLELVIGLVIISFGIIGIISMMKGGLRFVDRTRQDVVAINLAREGVEAMYSLRNTNWLKRSGRPNECWLLVDSFGVSASQDCGSVPWMASGFYIPQKNTVGDQSYFAFISSNPVLLDLSDGLSLGEEQYALCENTEGWYPCPGLTTGSSEGRYYRQFVGKGLFRKDVSQNGGEPVQCSHGAALDSSGRACNQGPLEYRFCVRVAGLKHGSSLIELCSSVTNFQSK